MPNVQTRVGKVFYREEGDGSPVVLLHATLHDHRDYDAVIETLARTNRVIAVDWPSHGRSEAVEQPTAVLFADILSDVVEALRLPPAVFVGNSVGGFAAARLAVNAPDRVRGLILVDSGGFAPHTLAVRLICRVLGYPAINRRVMPPFVRSYMAAQTAFDRDLTARVAAAARTRQGSRTAASLGRSFTDAGHDLHPVSDQITAPTLIIWGAKDTAIPPRIGEATHLAIANSTLHILDTGHVVFASAPNEFLALAQPFIASLEINAEREVLP